MKALVTTATVLRFVFLFRSSVYNSVTKDLIIEL